MMWQLSKVRNCQQVSPVYLIQQPHLKDELVVQEDARSALAGQAAERHLAHAKIGCHIVGASACRQQAESRQVHCAQGSAVANTQTQSMLCLCEQQGPKS